MAFLTRFPQFFYKGMTEFSQAGFLENSKHFDSKALDVDMKGKVVVITGANSGLGKVTAMELAKKGATVHMLCRNEQKGIEAQKEIQNESGNKDVHLHKVDVSEMNSIKEFYEKYNQKSSQQGISPCHVLIHNAGMISESFATTKEGLETSFATNTLGMYYLNKIMVPNLEASRPSRVVVVSSGGMYNRRLDVRDLQWKHSWYYNGILAYAYNKREGVELTTRWNEMYNNKGIRFFSMHPGWASTPGVSKSLPSMDKYLGPGKLRTPLQGADTIIWLSCAREPLEYANSDFFFDRKAVSPHLTLAATSSTPKEVDSLVSQCEGLVEEALNHTR